MMNPESPVIIPEAMVDTLLSGPGRARLPFVNGALSFVSGPHSWMLQEMVKYAPNDKGEEKPWLPAINPETGEGMYCAALTTLALSLRA